MFSFRRNDSSFRLAAFHFMTETGKMQTIRTGAMTLIYPKKQYTSKKPIENARRKEMPQRLRG